MTVINVPIKLPSPNKPEHWTQRHKRNRKLKLLLHSEFNKLKKRPSLPCKVTITRIAPRPYDYDNFVYACKGLRDILADLLIPNLAPGQADANPSITWIYTQEKKSKSYLIRSVTAIIRVV